MTGKTRRRQPIHPLVRELDAPVEIPADLAPHIKPEDYIAFERERRFRYRVTLEFLRRIMNDYGIWKDCPRVACRRAGQCVSEEVACRTERRHYLANHVYPHVRGKLRRAEMRYAEEQSQGRKK